MNDVGESNVENSQAQELVAAYRGTEKSQTLARRCITLLILGVIVVHVCLLWAAVRDFQYNRLPEFTAAMGVEVANISPKFVNDVRNMVNRLYPHYVSVFQDMFERDWPKITDAALKEMSVLDAYAQERRPEVEKGILDVALTSEEVIQEELNKIITPKEAEEISAAYGEVLQDKYNAVLSTTLREHVKMASDIGKNLEKIIVTEPDIKQPISMQESLGILLELVGTEIQKGM